MYSDDDVFADLDNYYDQSQDHYDEKLKAAKIVLICPECNEDPANIVEMASEIICTSCGLVLMDRLIDPSTEWRTFADDDNGHGGADPNRVGAAKDPLFLGEQMSTVIGNDMHTAFTGFGNSNTTSKLKNMHKQVNDERDNSALRDLYSDIENICVKLDLAGAVVQQTCLYIKYIVEYKTIKINKINRDLVIAGSIVLAVKTCGKERSISEIARACGVKKMEAGKWMKVITQFFKEQKADVKEHEIKQAKLADLKAQGPDFRRERALARRATDKIKKRAQEEEAQEEEYRNAHGGEGRKRTRVEEPEPEVSEKSEDVDADMPDYRETLGDKINFRTPQYTGAERLIPRYCSALRLDEYKMPAMRVAARASRDLCLLTGRQPSTVSAACILLTVRAFGVQCTAEYLCTQIDIKPGTVKNAYKILFEERFNPALVGNLSADTVRADPNKIYHKVPGDGKKEDGTVYEE